MSKLKVRRLLAPFSLLLLSALNPIFLHPSDQGIKISLRIYSGYSYLSAGDINEGVQGLLEAERWNYTPYWAISESSNTLHGGTDFGADLIIHFNDHLGLSIGAGMIHSSGSSSHLRTAEYDDRYSALVTHVTELSALPIRVGLFFTRQLTGRISLTASGGISYYAPVTFKYTRRSDYYSPPPYNDTWETTSIGAHKNSLGFQGGLGAEFKVMSKIRLFVEAQGRYARFSEISNAWRKSVWSWHPIVEAVSGSLYVRQFTGGSELTFSEIIVYEMVPDVVPSTEWYRPAKLDLSGFCLLAGFRIGF
ncbi:MAG: hypothetical protein R6X21_11920 [Candidatus Aminicenantes bacterium]